MIQNFVEEEVRHFEKISFFLFIYLYHDESRDLNPAFMTNFTARIIEKIFGRIRDQVRNVVPVSMQHNVSLLANIKWIFFNFRHITQSRIVVL